MLEYYDVSEVDLCCGSEVLLPCGVQMQAATVIGKSRDNSGRVIGHYDSSLILSSRVHNVMLLDVAIQQYAANIIA